MITFIDEKGTEHSALVAYSVTSAVNGELSVKGTIYTNDKVLHGIGRGWRFRLDDEYYRITYAKPNDTGRQIEVEFDAVHQFFYDMSKSMVYTTLNGSKPFETYLQAIFSNSGYTYNLETTVGSIRKESFGNKSRLSLFNDIIKTVGLEFSVRGHVVRILKRIGTDLSTIVRKDFNMNELKIEKDINSFVTYQRGLGAWKDDEDHSKGRYETSYESPLSAIYGRIEADPVVDERYKDTGKLLERLKENVDKSYKVSVEIDMEDLSQAGYRISRPNPGDYIMAINETLGFRQKVRIVSFTSEYDVGGKLISRKVVCNDIGTVQRATSEISHLSRTLTDSIERSERALKTATRALVSADGKNTNYFGDVKPLDVPKGTLRKGDRLFLTVGDKKQLYFWNGAEWELEPTEFDHEKFDMEFNRKSQEIKKVIQENRQKAIEALQNAGASTLLAQEAKRIGLDSIAKLDEFKRQATSAQTALSGDFDVLKRTIANDIRPKQAQAEAEIAKQVEALSRTKNELAGVKSAQATYEETTTRRLSELTNLANGKASSTFKQRADSLDAGVRSLTEGLRTKADISALNVTAENIRQSVKNLETDTQNKLNQKLSLAEFEVRAGSIRQEILNATKDKADKTLVITEAGKLREEFSKMKVGSRNYAEDYDFSRGLWYYTQGDNSPQDWTISNGEYNVKGTTNTWKQMQIFSKEGSIVSGKSSTALLELELGETYTLSFQGICYSGNPSVWVSLRANRTVPGNPGIIYGSFNLTSSWQTYQVTIPALTKPDNFDFWRIILGYNEIGHVAFRKVELTRSSTRIDAGPAPEDGKTDLVVAKSDFQKTAEGLSAKLATVETYVNQDGQRQEALQRYTREESARQATAVRELVNRDFVGKSTYQEDVRGLERRFEAITNPKNGLIATQIATYKNAVDGRFTEITSLIAGKANQTDFQHVKETSQLYERIIGSNENDISNKVARMALTNQLFQVEVSKNENLKTVQSQLAGSWGVHNKNSVNEIIAGFNLAGRNVGIKAETIRLEGNTLADKLTAIDGYFKRLFVGEGTFATLNTDVIRTNSITADKLVFNEALANRMVSNEIITSKLVASRAFVNALNAVTIDASQIVTGTLKGDRIYGGTIRGTEINGTAITGNSRMTIGDNGFLRPTQEGGLQINVPETYSANKGIGVQLFGRNFGKIPKGMFIYNSPNWNGGNIIGDNTEDILLTVKGRVSLCNLHNGSPVSGVPIISNFEYQNPIRNLYPIRFIGWDPRSNQLYVDDGTGKSGTWWISVDGSTSDKNLKTNIGDTHYNALDFVQKLMFKEFDWKTDKFGYKKPYTNVGLIAQDVEKIDSSLVYKKGETLALDDFRLLNIALKAIQELALENRKLTHRLENLENERRTA